MKKTFENIPDAGISNEDDLEEVVCRKAGQMGTRVRELQRKKKVGKRTYHTRRPSGPWREGREGDGGRKAAEVKGREFDEGCLRGRGGAG